MESAMFSLLSSSMFSACRLLPAATSSSRWRDPTSEVVLVMGGGAGGRDYNGQGNLVDENMVVLRSRLQQMKSNSTVEEAGDAWPLPPWPPLDWMEWQKRYYLLHYNEDVCQAVGLLQRYLLNTRPCLALGTLSLIILSVPISCVGVILDALEITTKGILPAGFLPNC